MSIPADAVEPLVVTPEDVARKAGITTELTPAQRETILDAILDAQADVEAYLGQPPLPVTYVETGAYPWPGGWRLTEHGDADIIRVVSADAEHDELGNLTGYFTVTYVAGLDPLNDPTLRPIIRFIRAHAMNSPEVTKLWQAATGTKGEIRSVSAEGQSVSWSPATLGGGGDAGSLKPGSLPTMESLDRWRVRGRRVYQGRTRLSEWPNESMVTTEHRDWFER